MQSAHFEKRREEEESVKEKIAKKMDADSGFLFWRTCIPFSFWRFPGKEREGGASSSSTIYLQHDEQFSH